MEIKIVRDEILLSEVKKLAQDIYGDMVKGVVDIDQGVFALGGEMHADAEAVLLKEGCQQKTLWGFNVYPDQPRDQWIQYQSLINIRPSQGNRSMEIQDVDVRERVAKIVNQKIKN